MHSTTFKFPGKNCLLITTADICLKISAKKNNLHFSIPIRDDLCKFYLSDWRRHSKKSLKMSKTKILWSEHNDFASFSKNFQLFLELFIFLKTFSRPYKLRRKFMAPSIPKAKNRNFFSHSTNKNNDLLSKIKIWTFVILFSLNNYMQNMCQH